MSTDKAEGSFARSRAKSRESRVLLMEMLTSNQFKQGNERPNSSGSTQDSERVLASGTSTVPTLLDNRNDNGSARHNDWNIQLSHQRPGSLPSQGNVSSLASPSAMSNTLIQKDATFKKGYSTVELSVSRTHSWDIESKPSLQTHWPFSSSTSTTSQKELVQKTSTSNSVKDIPHLNPQKQSSTNEPSTSDVRSNAPEPFETKPQGDRTQTNHQNFDSDMSLSEGVESVTEELKKVQESEVEALRKVDRLQERIKQLRKRKQQLLLRLKQATSSTAVSGKNRNHRNTKNTVMRSSSSLETSRKRTHNEVEPDKVTLVSSTKAVSVASVADESNFRFLSKIPRLQDSSSATVSVELPNNKVAADSPSLIHHACRRYSLSESVVAGAIRVDPENVCRRLSTSSILSEQGKGTDYEYPINIAIQQNATLPVLKLLANAGPGILAERDGPEQCPSLSCALHNRRGFDVMSLLLAANPNQARTSDCHGNLPLHVACLYGSPLSVVKLLASSYRCGLWTRNLQGESPLDIAQKHGSLCSGEVVDYLQLASFGMLEEDPTTTQNNHGCVL